MKYSLIVALFFLPLVSFAQSTGSIQGLIGGSIDFINSILIPFILGIAFLFFVINAVRFFIVGGSSDEGKENAKSLAIYSIGTFVFILAFWGLINVIASGIGLDDADTVTPDYMQKNRFYREDVRQNDYCRLNPGSIDCK